MGGEARLALRNVQVNRRLANVYVYDDRIVVATDDGERIIPMRRLERVATRRSWRGQPRLLLSLSDDEIAEVSKLDATSTAVAHRTIVEIARRFH
jgi:hypothetical protein